MLIILATLAVAYVVLKTLNMNAKFEERDRERELAEQAAKEEDMEFTEVAENAVDVEAETDIDFEVENE